LPEPDAGPEPEPDPEPTPPVAASAPPSDDVPKIVVPMPESSGGPDVSTKPAPVPASSPSKKKSKKGQDRKWVRHEVIPGDRLDTIADRYGVTRKALIRWNKLDPNKALIRVGQKLKVYARVVPPPRREISYVVKKGDTWVGIAKKYGVEERLLRRWNKKVPRKFKYGTTLRIWVEGKEESGSGGGSGGDGGEVSTSPLPTVSVRGNGYSVGKPNRGKLVNGVQLPKNDELYERRDPDLAYGTSHTIETMQLAIARWRRDYDFDGKLVVASISKRGGGRFRPHSSHQTGRDVDIRMPVKAGIGHTMAKNSSEIDWDATWALIQAFLETEQVQYIFLSYSRQKRLYSAAKRAGVSKKKLEAWIQYPNKPKTNNGIVRHAEGHTSHIHVRFVCGPSENRCVSY
jgi:LysM repeat protein